MKWRLMRGKQFASEKTPPYQSLLYAGFQFNHENTNMAYSAINFSFILSFIHLLFSNQQLFVYLFIPFFSFGPV